MHKPGARPAGRRAPFIDAGHFVVATRDTGYRDTASAVAELVDNAIQVNATEIAITVVESRILDVRAVEIAVVDNGSGMSPDELTRAIQFGGSTRFNNRDGIGRFGMGLPNSSVSQSRRFDVFTWGSGVGCYHSYFDLDEVVSGRLGSVPVFHRTTVPEWIQSPDSHGTAVLWSRCDRLAFKKAVTVAAKLRTVLGRKYRHFLQAGCRIQVNGEPIRPIDPLFLDGPLEMRGVPFGEPLIFDLRIPCSSSTTCVEVRFTELPVRVLSPLSNREKRELGITGSAGVSFVRANREVDYTWALLGNKRRENYDDWWRCEVRFRPEADELFGITHSKQGVNPTRYVRDTLGPDLESIARILNSRVRAEFSAIRASAPSRPERVATVSDEFLPVPVALPRRRTEVPKPRVTYAHLPSPDMFTVWESNKTLVITINTAHPLFTRLLQPLRNTHPNVAEQVELLMIAAARAQYLSGGKVTDIRAFHESWADAFALFSSQIA